MVFHYIIACHRFFVTFTEMEINSHFQREKENISKILFFFFLLKCVELYVPAVYEWKFLDIESEHMYHRCQYIYSKASTYIKNAKNKSFFRI